MPLLPLCAFVACYRVKFTFTFTHYVSDRVHVLWGIKSDLKPVHVADKHFFEILTPVLHKQCVTKGYSNLYVCKNIQIGMALT